MSLVQRRVYILDHMEFIQRWADVDRLQALKTLLRAMNKLSGIRSSETWIDSRISALRFDASSQQLEEPPHAPCAPVQRELVLQISTKYRLRRGTSEHSAMLSAQSLEVWDRPDYREKQSASKKLLWQRDEYREKMSEVMLDLWARPGHREKTVASMSAAGKKRGADPKHEASRQSMADKHTFRRSDDPKMQEKWDKYVAAAEAWASGLQHFELDAQHHNSFIILHLDGRQYDYPKANSTLRKTSREGTPSKLTHVQTARISKDFFDKASTGSQPFFNASEVKVIVDEIGLTTREVRHRLALMREQWLRAAAVLRRMGVVVDYASIDHLKWMA